MLNAQNLTTHIGSEITGLDLTRAPAAADIAELLNVLDHRGVVILRDQSLTLDQFMAFSRALGPLDVHPLRKFSRPGFPELTINSNIIENGQPIGLADAGRHWHTDGAYLTTPYRATILYGVEIPFKDGVALGDTLFSSTSAAFDALAPAMREKLSALRGLNCHGVARKKHATELKLDAALSEKIQQGVEHAVVRHHPNTGRACLYVNRGCTQSICGLPEAESDALLEQLFAQVEREEFIYHHHWRVGDIVMWDNCSTQHRAIGDYALPLRRLVYRTLLKNSQSVH